jgi:hypothetical protein
MIRKKNHFRFPRSFFGERLRDFTVFLRPFFAGFTGFAGFAGFTPFLGDFARVLSACVFGGF